jgi:hypothetical protein
MNLVLENRYYGDVYYTVTIDEDHQSGDTWYEHSFQDVDAWCGQTFGEQDLWGEDPKTGWKRMRNRYFFTDKNKRDWFVLKWS